VNLKGYVAPLLESKLDIRFYGMLLKTDLHLKVTVIETIIYSP
jgi:hypothetical protein